MWLIVTTGSDDFFQFFHVVVGSCVLCHDTGFSLGAADVGCPHREAPTPVHPNRPITAQDTSMGLAHANCCSSADAGHKLHINRSLEAFSTPSRCDLVTRTEAPTLRPPQKSHWLKTSHPHKSLSLHWTAKVVMRTSSCLDTNMQFSLCFFDADVGWICCRDPQ